MKAARKLFLLILAILLVATAASGALQAAAFYYGQWVGFGTVTGTSARTEMCIRDSGTGASMDPDSLALWEKEHLEYAAALPERFSVPHYITLTLLRAV